MIMPKDYQKAQTLSERLLYLTSMFEAAKEHLRLVDRSEDYSDLNLHLFNVINDMEIAINELYDIYSELELIEEK